METKHKIGLTIGKFAPLHRGHQFLIETALKNVDELVVMIYDHPEITKIPLEVRAGWIRKLYPKVKVIEAYDSPKKVGRDDGAIKAQVDYILKKAGGMKITHFFSSEWYGKHVAKALNAENVIVDPKREKYPISGSLTRENLEKHKDMLESIVYDDVRKYSKE